MKIVETSFTAWLMVFGVLAEANIIDDIIMHNWRDKGPVMKQSDPFFNPFGFSFPLFDSIAEETARAEDLRIEKNTGDGKSDGVKKENLERAGKKGKPWFSISEFLTMPESGHKLKTEARKSDSLLAPVNDKITQTGDLAQTKSTDIAVTTKQKDTTSSKTLLFENPDHQIVKRQLDDKNRGQSESTETTEKAQQTLPKSSFPRGLSDILIIFQKVGPKPKSAQLTSPSMHACDDLYCRNGMCGIRREDFERKEEEPTKHNTLLGHYDRVCLLIIPIALGVGTVLFILELRRIFRKMKKQAKFSTFENQEC